MIQIICIYALQIENTSESDPCSYEATKAVTKKAQKKIRGFNRMNFLSFLYNCFSCSITTCEPMVCSRKLAFCNNGSRDIITPKMICNNNIISRYENRSKLVILQSFSILWYIFRKWEHFQITKFNRVYMAGGQPLPPATFSHTNLLNISEI